jgi:hypothetical protein
MDIDEGSVNTERYAMNSDVDVVIGVDLDKTTM